MSLRILIIFNIFYLISLAQNKSDLITINLLLSEFKNSTQHWYQIKDTDKIIYPEKDQKRYNDSEFIKIADNVILFQKFNGGWPKNYDMQAILTDEQKTIVLNSKNILNTCFDNSTSFSHINYLAKVYSLTKNPQYKTAIINGINFILSAQYKNGGWPQYYPDTSGYRKFITYNDGAMIGIMNFLKKIVDRDTIYDFVDTVLYNRILHSFNRGIECLLNTQIVESDSLLVWCQQHNQITLKPESARAYELASLCNGESAEIVDFLMSIKNPDERIIKAVKSAVKWFEASKIYGIKVKTIDAPHSEYQYSNSDYDKIVIEDMSANPIWARYYSLETHIPIFCNRDGKIVYQLSDVERERRVGYAWYVYNPQKVLDKFPTWLSKINENKSNY